MPNPAPKPKIANGMIALSDEDPTSNEVNISTPVTMALAIANTR
jgi:hypothetical protein